MITIPENYAIYIDLAIIVLYCISFVAGYKKGFLIQIISTIGTILAFIFAWRYSSIGNSYFELFPRSITPLQDTLMKDAVYAYANQIAWFFVLFIVFRLLLYVLEKLLSGLKKIPLLKQVSGLLGGILGLIMMTVWMLVFAMLLNTSIFQNGRTIKNKTYLNQITSGVSMAIENLGIPFNSTEAFNKLYTDSQNLSDADKEAITSWLKEHGFKSIEEIEKEEIELKEKELKEKEEAEKNTEEDKKIEEVDEKTEEEKTTEEGEEKTDASGN